jgi:hypothetical protein
MMFEQRSEDEIDSAYVHYLRVVKGMTQAEFWTPVGVSQPRGHRYEMGDNKIPTCVRKLLFVRYVAGLDLDDPKQADFRNLKRLLKERRDNEKGEK